MFLHWDVTQNIKYDRETKAILKKVLKYNSNCIDIGCHKGEILDLMLHHAPKGNHLAFEPIPFLYQDLKQKFKNDPVEVYPYALAEKECKTTFNVVKNALSYSGLKQRAYNIKNPDIEAVPVEVKVLDQVWDPSRKIDLIKLDVEGAEFEVLKGAKTLLKQEKPYIIFEFGLGASDFYNVDPQEVFAFLVEEVGLEIYTLAAYLASKPSLDLSEFVGHYERNDEYYFVAV